MCVCETRLIIYKPYPVAHTSCWWQRLVRSSSCVTQDVATVLLTALRWFTDVSHLSIHIHATCAPNNRAINCRYIWTLNCYSLLFRCFVLYRFYPSSCTHPKTLVTALQYKNNQQNALHFLWRFIHVISPTCFCRYSGHLHCDIIIIIIIIMSLVTGLFFLAILLN